MSKNKKKNFHKHERERKGKSSKVIYFCSPEIVKKKCIKLYDDEKKKDTSIIEKPKGIIMEQCNSM